MVPRTFPFIRVLRQLDLILFSVCAIVVLDGLGAIASIGVPAVAWTVIILAVFFIPYGLITAELGAAYPQEGGLFVWIQRAFGDRWAARGTWCYWVSIGLGMPSTYLLFASVFSRLFLPDLSLEWIVAIAIGMTWLTILAVIFRLNIGKWVPNLGAIIKMIIILSLGVGGIAYALRYGAANYLSLRTFLPGWNSGLAFLPVIVFNFLGFELASGAGEEIQKPDRNVPAAIIISGVLIALFYLLATLGILLALPRERISLLGGIIDTLEAVLGASGIGQLAVTSLGIGVLWTFYATEVSWTMGTSRMAAEAATKRDFPRFFGWRHSVHGSPISAALLTGIISTLVLIVYTGIASSEESLFWSLFAFASIVFLLPYLLLFPAFLKLHLYDTQTARPYRLPGGKILAWIATGMCTLVVFLSIVFFVWVPGLRTDWSFTLPVMAGVGITLAAGEALLRKPKRLKLLDGTTSLTRPGNSE